MSRICRIMGDPEKIWFCELVHESKMRLLKTHPHTSKRPGYGARKTRRRAIEGNADTRIRQATDRKPAAYRRCDRGGRNRKAPRQNKPPKKALWQGKPSSNASRAPPMWWGGRDEDFLVLPPTPVLKRLGVRHRVPL